MNKSSLPRIGVMAPSSYVERDDIEKSKVLLESKGYSVFVHPQTYERDRQSAGNGLQKSLAFQGLWQRPDIDVIWAAGGGNRALGLLDSINFEKLKGKPKTLAGFSDVTALLNAIYAHTGLSGLHAQVFKNLHKMPAAQLDFTLALLSGEKPVFPLDKAEAFYPGTAEGPLVGGNLSIFQYLPQTLPGAWLEGALLFLEDCGEEWNRFDRMLLHLKRTGVFGKIAGLIIGQLTDMKDTGRPYGFTLEDMLHEHLEGREIPVVLEAPFGHGQDLYALPVGGKARLAVTDKKATLSLL
ncbi:MAG: LD-carboxypeptidase [Alphaproteobacteria bacterium]|nr:LD-carboxypeptidase [Alphaproteobacteria bacterium]